MRERVSEVVTIKEVESWKPSDIITIKAGTGTGKSYFIKNNLYAIAKRDKKRILMLIHRKNCTDQFLMEIEEANKTDIIDIRTYQSIEAVERSGVIFEFGHYDYICADEWHYFLSDSSFNKFCDISLKAILNTKAIKIFMSATGDTMKRILKGEKLLGLETIDYEIPFDYSFIKKLQFFYKYETLESYIRYAIKHNEKAIFFIDSVRRSYELFKKYKDVSIFNCAEGHEYYKHVNKEQINDILKNEGFDKVNRKTGKKDSTDGKLILFTSTVMDAGVNIIMPDLHHIVCDVKDTGTLIQCIGRKRIRASSDYINLYIKAMYGKQLGGRETQLRNKIEVAEYFIEHGERKLVNEFYREINDVMIYDEVTETGIKKKLNLLMYLKVLDDIFEIEKMKAVGGKHPYCQYLTEKIFKLGHFRLYEAEEEAKELEVYLSGLQGKKLFKEDQKELIDRIDLRVDGKQQRSYKKLNDGLDMIKANYIVKRDVDKRRKLEDGTPNHNRDKTYWEVVYSIK